MAWFLFIDESGHDRLASPYEVLAGVAIRDQVLRELIARLHDAEVASFGRRYSDGHRELKGAVLLKRKVFRHGALSAELDLADLPSLARAALDDGARANARMLLIDQMHRYFEETAVGRHRASRIIPEPFFVHSDLTTGVQIADLLAYVISWGFRMPHMTKSAREELAPFAKQIARLRYRAVRERFGNPEFKIWSFAHIADLRTQAERDED